VTWLALVPHPDERTPLRHWIETSAICQIQGPDGGMQRIVLHLDNGNFVTSFESAEQFFARANFWSESGPIEEPPAVPAPPMMIDPDII